MDGTERFLHSLKREHVRRGIYRGRDEAGRDVFDDSDPLTYLYIRGQAMRQEQIKRYRTRLAMGCIVLLLAEGAPAFAQSLFATDDTPNNPCTVAARFPDGRTWNGKCQMSILRAGVSALAPKGMVQIVDTSGRGEIFSMTFFPPKDIQVNKAYALSSARDADLLGTLVQPYPGEEKCQMNAHDDPGQGTVTFTAIGSANVQFHGTIAIAPTCTIYQGTPQRRLVPGGSPGGGSVTVTF